MTIHDRHIDADIQTVESGGTFSNEDAHMEMIAKIAAQTLNSHYPNHIWAVGWAPGMALVVKNLAIEDGRYGYTVDVARAATISEVEHAVMIGGGELLERCGVVRGAWDGEMMSYLKTDLKDHT